MKVFLSWSGHRSYQVASVFKEWLPSVIQSIDPFVSSEDISKGDRWSSQIAKELEESAFGILCVTKENLDAPWLMFEAGALSKLINKSFVCPFLFDLKMSEVDKKNPILQFQSTINEKEDIRKLVVTLNSACGETQLSDEQLKRTFDVWWPKLEQPLNELLNAPTGQKEQQPKKSDKDAMLEEVLELARVNQKILRSPEDLFPQEYFENILSKYMISEKSSVDEKMQLQRIYNSIERMNMHAMRMNYMLDNDFNLEEFKERFTRFRDLLRDLRFFMRKEFKSELE